MEEQIDYWQLLQPLIWVLGAFSVVVSALLGWIVLLLRSDRDGVNLRFEKHEGWILASQKEIQENSEYVKVTLAIIQEEQKNSKTHFERLEKHLEQSKAKKRKR